MARIKTTETSAKFNELKSEARQVGENNDCVPKALAIAFDISYEEARAACEHARTTKRGGKRGGTLTSTIAGIVHALAKTHNRKIVHAAAPGNSNYFEPDPSKVDARVAEYRKIIDSYPGAGPGLKSITTHHARRYPKVWAQLPPAIMLVARHAVGFRDGEVHDWSVNKALRVQDIFFVLPGEEEEPTPEAPATDETPETPSNTTSSRGEPNAAGYCVEGELFLTRYEWAGGIAPDRATNIARARESKEAENQ